MIPLFDRVLRVGGTDAFELDVTAWTEGEALVSATVTSTETNSVTVGDTTFENGLIRCLLNGVAAGYTVVEFNFNTATRTGCYKALVRTAAC